VKRGGDLTQARWSFAIDVARARRLKMRVLMHAKFGLDEFNKAVRDNSIGDKIGRILEEAKPEAVYFTDYGGSRGAILVININDSSEIPAYAEPWFLQFNATVEFHVAMTPQDLGKAGLDKLGKKWS
jgi:hypothetical protein